MADSGKFASPLTFDLFGDLLKYLRRRAQLTQRELAIAVGYSEAHVSRLEKNQRLPDLSTLAALFIPALGLEDDPEAVALLLELAAKARGEPPSQKGKFTITRAISKEVIETVETVEIPSNLPLELTSFVGREGEIEEIKEILQVKDKGRLLTLLGAGGCGKTRLALQAAKRAADSYPDGVWFVDLAPLTDANIVPRVTASVIGVPETTDQPITKNLMDFLRPRTVLIVFDNCEHVVTATSNLIETLLRACPHVQVLSTSREVLNVPGEIQFQVSPLPTPPASQKHEIAEYDSVRLFIERAQNIQPAFDLTDENASSIAGVCRRLDGIPLAIELAAARVNLLRVQQIESKLDNRFNLLNSGKTTLPRHQTLRAMIDWSYDLLSSEESILLCQLAVFAGGWSLEAANAVTTNDNESNTSNLLTLEYLSHLVDKSFIIAKRQPGVDVRYSMLETIRAYALEKLATAEETELIRQRHSDFFHKFAQDAQLYGAEKQYWLDRLETEHDNIRAALAWSLESSAALIDRTEKGAELILSILDFYWFRGYSEEARGWMNKFLEIESPPSPLRALLLQKTGWFTRTSGDFKKADALLKQALEMALEIGDKNRAVWALGDLGLSAREQGNARQSISYFSEALPLARESGENRAIGVSLYNLAESYQLANDLHTSRDLWEQGLSIFRTEGDKTHIAWGLEGIAGTAYLGKNFADARKFHLESLKFKVDVMDKLGITYSFEGLAQVVAAEGAPARAAVLWGAANRLREIMNVPLESSREDVYTSLTPIAHEQIGDEVFNDAWKKGEAMTIEQAIEYALQSQQ